MALYFVHALRGMPEVRAAALIQAVEAAVHVNDLAGHRTVTFRYEVMVKLLQIHCALHALPPPYRPNAPHGENPLNKNPRLITALTMLKIKLGRVL